ncbi:MAG: LysM peptidoglycan-binding domain-containing protein, partial [Chlamydiales bacterium]
YLLLVTDFQFATRKLDDSQVCQVLHLLSVKSNEALSFAKKMAASNRGDLVCREAKEWLADILELSEEEVAGRFVPRPGIGELRPIFRDPPPASPPPQVHLIQPGESLWLIARKYSVSIDALIEFNHLPSTVIRPGQTLKIPPS